MTTLSEFAQTLLHGPHLEDKLFSAEDISFEENFRAQEKARVPGRSPKLNLMDDERKQDKFPRAQSLHDQNQRARALHFFANHELQAIEMMAQMLLLFPHDTAPMKKFKQALLFTIADEQKHLRLYVERMKTWGMEFGDLALSDFFWKQMHKIHSPESYLAVMALTFEAANLDFAYFYQNIFEQVGDKTTSRLMRVVLEDEIKHVHVGYHFLSTWHPEKELWSFYKDLLPKPMTPARARGVHFNEEARKQSGFPPDFIDRLKNYEDDFPITRRRKT